MKKLIYLLILTGLASCNPYDVDEILIPREDISLTIKGTEHFSYDPVTCQASQNVRENEYRYFDDMMSQWLTVKCSESPVNEGQELTADISWTGSRRAESMSGLEFTVEKTGDDGKIWMWCKKKSVGIVIKKL